MSRIRISVSSSKDESFLELDGSADELLCDTITIAKRIHGSSTVELLRCLVYLLDHIDAVQNESVEESFEFIGRFAKFIEKATDEREEQEKKAVIKDIFSVLRGNDDVKH